MTLDALINRPNETEDELHVRLGGIIIQSLGKEKTEELYGTTSPKWVGMTALEDGDIAEDGTLA